MSTTQEARTLRRWRLTAAATLVLSGPALLAAISGLGWAR